jgi:methylglutaconyl-CoA hydratase
MMRNGPAALAAAKDLLAEAGSLPIDDGLIDRMVERTAAIRATAEARQGIEAFLAKRPPPWTKG